MSKYLNWASGKNGALGKVSGLSTEYFVGAADEHGVLGRAWPPAMPSASQERPFIKTSSGVIWHDGNITGTATLAAFAL